MPEVKGKVAAVAGASSTAQRAMQALGADPAEGGVGPAITGKYGRKTHWVRSSGLDFQRTFAPGFCTK